jgi:hypothetical protein
LKIISYEHKYEKVKLIHALGLPSVWVYIGLHLWLEDTSVAISLEPFDTVLTDLNGREQGSTKNYILLYFRQHTEIYSIKNSFFTSLTSIEELKLFFFFLSLWF